MSDRDAIEQVRAGVTLEQASTETRSFQLALASVVLDHEQRLRDIEEALNRNLKTEAEDGG